MKKYFPLLTMLLGLTLFSKLSLASPASMEYVNNQIKEAVAALTQKMEQDHQNTQSKMDEIPEVKLFQIGDLYQGGIIFWLDDSKQHGLIAAKTDANQGQGIQWQNGESGDKITNARADGLYAGLTNTQLIIAQQTMDDQEGHFAALGARDFAVLEDGLSVCTATDVCYSNWYLPSLTELKLLRASLFLQGAGDFSNGLYWSSTETGVNQVQSLDFTSGNSVLSDKASTELRVRPIHSF